MYPDQEYRNNGGSCHLKRYKKGLHLFEQQVKTKQICQQLSPNDWLEFVCKWLYDTLECTFILCRLYRIRVHLFIFNAVSSLLKYMQFALQCNRSIYALYENDTNGSEDKVVRTASIWNSTTFWQQIGHSLTQIWDSVRGIKSLCSLFYYCFNLHTCM